MDDKALSQSTTLPWWTFVLPALVCHLGTQLSLHFQFAPGVAIFYLPIPLAIAMVQWWGPRVLIGLYLNAVLCAGLWGLPKVALWPVYALPETLAVCASWLLFTRIARGRCWLPTTRETFLFIALALVPAACFDGFQVPGQMLLLGDLAAKNFWGEAWGEWMGTLSSGFAVAAPLLFLLTPWLERKGWSLTSGAYFPRWIPQGRNKIIAFFELGIVLGLPLILSFFLPVSEYWFVYAIIGLWVAQRFGIGMAMLSNSWMVFLTLILPTLAHYHGPLWKQEALLVSSHIGLCVICALSIISGSNITTLLNEVAARAQSEEDLLRAQAFLQAAMDCSPACIAIADAPDGKLRYVNDAGLFLGGNDRQSLVEGVGIDLYVERWNFVDLEGKPLPTEEVPLVRAIRFGETCRRELMIRNSEGEERLVSANAAPIRDESQAIVAGIVVFTDITERKQAEADIRRLNEQLEQRVIERTAQLAAANTELESFSYSVSHDLRAPLRHIQGYVGMLNKDSEGQLSEKSQRYLKVINDAGKEMTQLIDDLLDFSRMGRIALRESGVNLDEVVQQTLRGLEMATQGRNLVWKIAPLPPVMGDPALIKQVFVNLIGNAVKYTRPCDPAQIEIGCCGEEAGRLVFYVRDNGVGFDMQYAHKLFGVFQRLHRAEEFEGTGIGLAIVRRIVTRHGDRVWAESKLNEGTTFYFTLKPAAGLL